MTTAADRYLARLRNVLAHIDAHLDETLDVARLAEVAAFSPYHFHRQFTLLFGVNVGRYVQLLRLKRAAHQLAYRDAARITDIALACGYEGPEAFARAFRKQSGQSPSAFRAAPQWGTWATDLQALHALRSEHMPHNRNPMPSRSSNARTCPSPPSSIAAIRRAWARPSAPSSPGAGRTACRPR